ncbi:cyclic peptide export ABC transporter [Herbaspirillum rubrisubalbicans]|uniref:Cyclic peptide export ABC transporter n=1 Tax=Herbaspirillum rubrisubalbicans TaxID=80842 RepID=A0AAD0U715_9BURK|nr:cyclic peptide export ABC transporter [Herbaspirillum rubrisubalbicans]AYR24493.1 cyclic peptide export ABC transporter [Herbaspirillum rubrisubalbicans]
MSLFRYLLASARWQLPVAFGASLAGGFSSAALVAMINQALHAPREALLTMGWRFLALALAVLLLRSLSQTMFMRMGQQAKAQLRQRLTRQITQASFRQLEARGPAKGTSILAQDLDAIVLLFIGLPNLLMQGSVIAGCLIYLGVLSWQVLAFALVSVALGAVGFHQANSRALFHLRGSRKREDELLRHFRALFDGAKELKLHAQRREQFLDTSIMPSIEAARVQRTRGYVFHAIATTWGNFIFFAFIGIVLFVLTRVLTIDSVAMSGYAMIFLYMILPIEAVLSAVPSLSSARVALERIDQISTELPPEDAGISAAAAPMRQIAMHGVTHSYYRERENGIFALGPIDLDFRPGELVFLVGGNGSGKTTLAKLLVGLYAPEEGVISLNGERVGPHNLGTYRAQFSAVFSDFHLFESLVGLPPEGLDDNARLLLDQLQLQHKVAIEDGHFSTTALSQGQRKRLALLVAYLEDRPFYVFDEWAADQDPGFKDVFYKTLLPALRARGKTVLVISHDDRYFDCADRCIRLDYGQLAPMERSRSAAQTDAGPAPGLQPVVV